MKAENQARGAGRKARGGTECGMPRAGGCAGGGTFQSAAKPDWPAFQGLAHGRLGNSASTQINRNQLISTEISQSLPNSGIFFK
jgi:hypothetical protein